MTVTDIAKVAHTVNKEYCKSLGDESQPDWEDAPEWQKKSAISGVNFHLSCTHAKPEHSHISWLKQKVDDGWVYGPVKDPDKKEHPCCVPYSDLPKEQQAKDYIFMAVVNSLKPYLTEKE